MKEIEIVRPMDAADLRHKIFWVVASQQIFKDRSALGNGGGAVGYDRGLAQRVDGLQLRRGEEIGDVFGRKSALRRLGGINSLRRHCQSRDEPPLTGWPRERSVGEQFARPQIGL
jgi:hypothetical protein